MVDSFYVTRCYTALLLLPPPPTTNNLQYLHLFQSEFNCIEKRGGIRGVEEEDEEEEEARNQLYVN